MIHLTLSALPNSCIYFASTMSLGWSRACVMIDAGGKKVRDPEVWRLWQQSVFVPSPMER